MVLIESFSGIRGIYGKELTDEVITRYAYAYFELLIEKNKNPKIVIGRDSRPSGEQVLNYLTEGLDCEIIDVGVLPTPAIENAVRFFNCDGGIIITASHNEPEYNGFKFLDKDGAILRPKEIDFVINRFHEINKKPISSEKADENSSNVSCRVNNVFNQKIIYKRNEAIEEYKKFLKEILKTSKIDCDIKILVDPNGGSGIVCKEIFDEFGVNGHYINMKEGEFKRAVEPNETSLKYLTPEINKNNCEFGIGFDCDADRVEILLNNGSLVSGNQILALIAEEILAKTQKNNKTIVVNDATSYIVKEMVEKYNANWVEVEVGEIIVVDEMIRTESQIAGEGSNGGVIIPPSRCRDGILTILILLKLIKEAQKSLKELIESLPKYYYFKEKIKLDEDFSLIRDKIKSIYQSEGFEIIQTGDNTGGLKMIKDNSWVWLRQSKTEDKVLRIITDSKDKDVSLKLLDEAKKFLHNII